MQSTSSQYMMPPPCDQANSDNSKTTCFEHIFVLPRPVAPFNMSRRLLQYSCHDNATILDTGCSSWITQPRMNMCCKYYIPTIYTRCKARRTYFWAQPLERHDTRFVILPSVSPHPPPFRASPNFSRCLAPQNPASSYLRYPAPS
jgi:hypothetical protein